MDRKQINSIAVIFCEAQPQPDWSDYTLRLTSWAVMVQRIADTLAQTIPHFDVPRFVAVCNGAR